MLYAVRKGYSSTTGPIFVRAPPTERALSIRRARIERTTRHGRTGASFPANSNPWKVHVESGSRFDFRSSGLERGPTGPFEITFFFLRFSPVIPIFPQRSTRSVHFSEGLVKWIPKICFFDRSLSEATTEAFSKHQNLLRSNG
ncbi:hypothetical protein TNCT_542661 [Trichonephila clavata]|uniref:Uncharacterized protein n=1 Tax=Trichonephila clavata TaxID=2740835 RepID=A0A8X6HYK7_TRICU|nr:hypothetical protein TNCT_542661 [Trichonephila clavata]